MSWFICDVEADGPCPGLYSMHEFALLKVDSEGKLDQSFHATLSPISENYVPEALAVCNRTYEETLKFENPETVMKRCLEWVKKTNTHSRPMFLSDNNGFDWQFLNYYFWKFCNQNPFGHSSTNQGSLFKGMQKDTFVSFKYLRKTKHDHNALNDCRGNAEALLEMKKLGLKISLK